MSTHMYDQIHEGMDVVDIDRNKIGKAGETLGTYFNVDAGFLGMKEYYVPFDAVTDVRDNSIIVNAHKDDLDSMGWDQPPQERGSSTTSDMGTYETTSAAREGDTMRLREEELQARKSSVETGRVHVGKEVVEEQQTMDVPVSREEVFVERRPVDRRPADRPIDESADETIRVPVREERVDVDKQPVVYEEVGVGKRTTQDTQRVSDTVRREELRTDEDGDVDVRDERNP